MGLFDLFRRKQRPAAEELPTAVPIALDDVPPLPPLSPGPATPPKVTEAATAAARDVVDRLRLLHPHHRGRLRLVADFSHGDARIAMTEVPDVGESCLPEWVVLDQGLHTAFLASHVAGLLGALGQDPSTLEGVELTLADEGLDVFGARIEVDAATLLYAEQFFAELDDVGRELDSRQQGLQARMHTPGPCSIAWDREARALVLTEENERTIALPAEFIGSFAPDLCSWCWAWGNPSVDESDSAAIASVRDAAVEAGPWPMLTTPEIPCCEPFAFTLAYVGAFRMGGKAVFRWPRPSGMQMFFAIDLRGGRR